LEVPGKIKCPYTSLTFSLIACGFLPRPLFFVSSQAKELMCPSPTPESYFKKMFSSAGVGRIFVEGLVQSAEELDADDPIQAVTSTDTPPTEQADCTEDTPQEKKRTGQPENELNNLPQSISTFLHLSRGRIEELTSLLSELSGTPLTTEITTNWLSLEPKDTENSQDSLTQKTGGRPLGRPGR